MKQQNAPKYFHIYLNSEETVNLLSDADRGKLLSMLYRFARDGEKPQAENPALAIAFSVFSRQIARDFEEYENRCRQNRFNAKKGGAPKGNRNASKAFENNRAVEKTTENNRTVEKTTETTQEEEKQKQKQNEEEEEEVFDAAPTALSAAAVLTLYQRICRSLPKVKGMTDMRERLISNLPWLDFAAYFQRVEQSDFLTGRNGKWQGCTLDWLLRPETVEKVQSGMYDNPSAPEERSYSLEELEQIDTLDWLEE